MVRRIRMQLAYANAAMSTVLAAGLQWLLDDELVHDPGAVLLFAVAWSAWIGGRGPGMAATVTAGLLQWFVFLSPHGTAHPASDMLAVALFLVVGSLLAGTLGVRCSTPHGHRDRRKVRMRMGGRGIGKRTRQLWQALSSRIGAGRRRRDEEGMLLSTVAHEMRNPLQAVLNAARLIESGLVTSDAVGTAAAIIRRQADQAARLVDDLVELRRWDLGSARLAWTSVRLCDAVDEALEALRPSLAEKHQSVRCRRAEDAVVRGDHVRLVQVFTNLIGNASRYSERGSAIAVVMTTQPSEVWVAIRDPGIGIEPERIGRIFEVFVQNDAASCRGGTGIGLAVTRRLVEAHGGSIEARSAGRGRGSEFTVRFPRP